MSESKYTAVLAVDGGGTRCRVALQRGDSITSVETGSANVSTDYEGAVQQVLDGLTALSEMAALSIEDLATFPAFVGLAGVTGADIAQRLRSSLPLKRLRIADDRPAALRGALGERDGVIAHCGTGSFYGAQMGGKMALSGGWGAVLGDEASAQWVGRTALKCTLETVDGRRAPSGLSSLLLDQFSGADGIVRFGASAFPYEFGEIAPMVTTQAGEGDALAIYVMSVGASEIARSLSLIGWTQDYPICLTGGIGPKFKFYLPTEMQAKVIAAIGEPMSGALLLARELAREAPK